MENFGRVDQAPDIGIEWFEKITIGILACTAVLHASFDVGLLVSDQARVFAKLPEGQWPSEFYTGTCSADMDTALKPELLSLGRESASHQRHHRQDGCWYG